MTRKHTVVVVGGGYAGTMAANRLTQRDDVAVNLINPRSEFVERLRLHQFVSRTDDAEVDFKDILSEKVSLTVDTATRIDAGGRRVELESGGTLGYDYLIYAVGSGSAAPAVPGAAEHAYPLSTIDDAHRLRTIVDAAPATAALTVVGAGATGVETASELAEAGRRVTLVCGGDLNPYLHAKGRRSVAKRMAKLGVTVLDGPGTKVAEVKGRSVLLENGQVVRSDVTVWTAGFGVPDLAVRSGLTTDSVGRLVTDESLVSVDDDRLFAAGDSASPSGLPLRMAAGTALPLGMTAADTILSRLAGESPGKASIRFTAQCLSLGRSGGLFQFADKGDNAIGVHIGGRAGAKVKEMVVKHTVGALEGEGRKPGSYTWKFKDAKREALVEAEGFDKGSAATADSAGEEGGK
ncbi:NAD(P)/FAD-dependent oxidoreductase [Salininema proteolyticum]|uniref:NAD(P)/FAD-dependent oxidoreductase n=1 Tax=Salininema proteolyticum TaxID=1607685 RepID=A0ABV8U459_9ACTN